MCISSFSAAIFDINSCFFLIISENVRFRAENLSNMVPDEWYSMYHYSHPPLLERLRAIEKHTAAKKNE